MEYKERELTDAEKAALTYGHFNGINNWTVMFDICMTCVTKTQFGKNEAVSRWKHDPSVQRYWKELDRLEKIKLNEAVKAELAKGNHEDQSRDLGIRDFTDINQFIAYLNEQANTIKEEKDKQTYLKMMADLMRFKDNSGDKNADIQRFYTPLQCSQCPLHKEAEAKVDEEKRLEEQAELQRIADERDKKEEKVTD